MNADAQAHAQNTSRGTTYFLLGFPTGGSRRPFSATSNASLKAMMNSMTKKGGTPREKVPIELLKTELASNTEASSRRPSSFSGFTKENKIMRGRKMNPIGVIS